jgi:hypothetical protein
MGHVHALFVDAKGLYPSLLPPAQLWTVDRDARRYDNSCPVVCHPPCQLWGKFAAINFKRWGGEHNRPGNDGGMFQSALDNVRRCNGVLEHPAFSNAWATHKLPKPINIGWNQVSDREWVCEVWQSAYGHPCRKRTWLYYHSALWEFHPYEGDWSRPEGAYQIGFHDQRGKERNKPTVSGREASLTPIEFARWLICLAHRAGYGR